MDAPHTRRSDSREGYLVVLALLIEGEVEVEDGFFEVLGEVHFLPACRGGYLYSLTMTVSWFLTEMMSV